jgi:hypothetical protein
MESEHHLTLADDQLDRLADRVASRLAASKPRAKPMLTVEDVSTTFQVSRAWVYENAGMLGGFKLGPGHRAPLRFEADKVAAVLRPLAPAPEDPGEAAASKGAPRRKRPRYLHPVYDG